MMLEKNFNYKDMRVMQREDLYFREEAKKKKKKQLLKDMFNIVEDTQKMRDKNDVGLEKFIKNWREKNGENS